MRSHSVIDLNADLGEGVGDDAAMMPLISSANIACGFHAGTPTVLRDACAAAVASDVRIGAQVSYPDVTGFGRRFMDVAPDDLLADVLYQVGALRTLAESVGGAVEYVKPHGALYNTVVSHEQQARAVVDAVAHTGLPLMCLPGSTVARLAIAADVPVITEAFADRGYTSRGTLVPRTEPGALLHDSATIADRVVTLARSGHIVAVDGTRLDVDATSVCLHGDTPGALAHARAVRDALADAGIDVRAR
ncbi:LamB/YcsF family protein [Gordonia liuliyuniae]|uniref:LamB/YcsF family protein n=1 Tax=Gordonia liuliyuniae TaxID=2911517 RepID=A0ABS9IVP7_9ACTN|nr:5-oxoprolinase subunit PxpA [Gordonia liuliyuniae]MCF8589626.1 LamB/YcsF family protein [Gordonia liuliyuniae]